MGKIFISTNQEKAKSCFSRSENDKKTQIASLVSLNAEHPVKKIDGFEIYLLSDAYSGAVKINYEIDFQNDCLLYHNESQDEFIRLFGYKTPSIHNDGAFSLFRKAYLIILDDTITDKYEKISALLSKQSLKAEPFINFLTDIENKKNLHYLQNTYPEHIKINEFQFLKELIFNSGESVYNNNDKTHLEALIKLRNSKLTPTN